MSLIGAVGATTASRGGLVMAWRPGRRDAASAREAESLCPMAGRLPDGQLADDEFPYPRTAAANRAKFLRQGFNDREMVALVGAHTIGGVQRSTSGFPSGLWTLRRDQFANTFFRNLLAFEDERYRKHFGENRLLWMKWNVMDKGECCG